MDSWSVFRDVTWLARRSLIVLRQEGVQGLGKWLAQQTVKLSHLFWFSQLYLIHVTNTADCTAGISPPPIDELEAHFLVGESDAERLWKQGYEDVRRVVRPASRRLQRGAVCACIFVDREVAHVEWLALSESVRRAVFAAPCFVDFDGGEAGWGGAYTIDKYRNRGIFQYGMSCALRYCHECGYRALVGATAVGNAPSVHGQTPYGPRVRALLRYRCLLLRRKWIIVSRGSCGEWPGEEEDTSSIAQDDCR